jgi:hypothetical protein
MKSAFVCLQIGQAAAVHISYLISRQVKGYR